VERLKTTCKNKDDAHKAMWEKYSGWAKEIRSIKPLNIHKKIQLNDWTIHSLKEELKIHNFVVMNSQQNDFCLFQKVKKLDLTCMKVDLESKDVKAFAVWETVNGTTMESKMAANESNYPWT